MIFLAIVLLFFTASAAFNEEKNAAGISCWSGMGLRFGQMGHFGTFSKAKCPPETKSCFSASFITFHGEVFAHRKGCAGAGGCSSVGNAAFDDALEGIAKRTDCALCFESNCNEPKAFALDFQLGEIECVSEVKAKALHSGGAFGHAANRTDLFTLQLPPKRIRCSAHSSWCVSAKCAPKRLQTLDDESFLSIKGCALPNMTLKGMDKLCENTINGKMEFFRFLPGTKIWHETETTNGTVSFDF